MLLTLALIACTGDKIATDDTSPAETGEESNWPEGLAPLTEISSGDCPDLSQTGTSSFTSSGESRTVTFVRPDSVSAETQVVFFFHGLSNVGQSPTEYLVNGLGLQDFADTYDAIIVLPESPIQEYVGQTFYLWDVQGLTDHDIVLYDDLRSCIGNELAPDLTRLSASGFSGGALFTTMIASQRGDTLSSFVEMSGGADLDVPLVSDALVAAYQTPAWQMPALLVTGGDNDAWPDPSFKVVDFVVGTDTLQDNLVEDGHYVVRCKHTQGHTITQAEWTASIEWLVAHEFGQDSPIQADFSSTTMASWCEEIE